MIQKLKNTEIEISMLIHTVFQLSYAIEAKLLNVNDFPPLRRPMESYLNSTNTFFGYFVNGELAGVIEVEHTYKHVDINSLVVHPLFFRQGIGRKLLEFTFKEYQNTSFIVETGIQNHPAVELYKKVGFKEIKQWNTDFGVRKVMFKKIMGKK